MSENLIIGAGPAGLTAAYELSRKGERAHILEADNQVGGISRTVNYHGYRFDIGGHRFFTKVDYIQQIWQEILGDEFLQRPRLSRIFYQNNFYDYPLKMGSTLANLGACESLRVGLSYIRTRLRPYPEEINLEQWVSNRFGDRLYRIFFKTYTEKVWGIPCSEISADWAAQRIKNLSLTEALRNALSSNGQTRDGEIITTLIEQFHYPRLGPGMMWEACAAKLEAGGDKILLGHRVEAFNHCDDRVTSVLATTQQGDRREIPVSQVVSTMSLRNLILALQPAPAEEVLAAARKLRYRDYLTVVLIIDRAETFPDNWIYVHSPEVKLGRVQNYKNWSPDMVPDPATTSLGLEYFLWEQDEEWQWSDDRHVARGISEAARIGLIRPEEVRDGTVVRMKKAYPVYDQNYRHSLSLLQDYIATFSNLQTIGRNGLHRYNNQDHSMLTGIYAARNIMGETNDVWSVNTEQSYHETTENSQTETGDRLHPVRLPARATDTCDDIESLLQQAVAPLHAPALGLAVGLVAGLSLILATLILLAKGGKSIGPHLVLINQYLWGYDVSLRGAILGFFQAGTMGFSLGSGFATLRNWGVAAYLMLAKYTED